ncbi:MAG: hypothetical protein HPY53_16975 [Brevinematales bacterium]|nr:hypothetical protein [Brevinematales bacterium]
MNYDKLFHLVKTPGVIRKARSLDDVFMEHIENDPEYEVKHPEIMSVIYSDISKSPNQFRTEPPAGAVM